MGLEPTIAVVLCYFYYEMKLLGYPKSRIRNVKTLVFRMRQTLTIISIWLL